MSKYVKGNYSVPRKKGGSTGKSPKKHPRAPIEEEFERRALARLGGSIAFVVKPSLVWYGEHGEEAGQTAR